MRTTPAWSARLIVAVRACRRDRRNRCERDRLRCCLGPAVPGRHHRCGTQRLERDKAHSQQHSGQRALAADQHIIELAAQSEARYGRRFRMQDLDRAMASVRSGLLSVPTIVGAPPPRRIGPRLRTPEFDGAVIQCPGGRQGWSRPGRFGTCIRPSRVSSRSLQGASHSKCRPMVPWGKWRPGGWSPWRSAAPAAVRPGLRGEPDAGG